MEREDDIRKSLAGLHGTRDPRHDALILAAARTFDDVMASNELKPEQLSVIIEAVTHRSRPVWESACPLLAQIVGRWPEATRALVDLTKSRDGRIRFQAYCSMGDQLPLAIETDLLKAGLKDKIADVRRRVGEAVERRKRKDLEPELEAATRRETNAVARRWLERSLGFLRDGYFVSEPRNGTVNVEVRVAKGVYGVTVRVEEFEKRGATAIAEELRMNYS